MNANQVQAASTIVLIGVTGYYAFVTNRIAGAAKEQAESSNRQAKASEAQLANAQEALEAQRKIAQGAATHSERVLIESTKARLSALTPPCTIWHETPDSMLHWDQTSLGNRPMSTYDNDTVRLAIRFSLRNDGQSTTLASAHTVEPIPDEATAPFQFGWVVATTDEAVAPRSVVRLEFVIEQTGRFFRRMGLEKREIAFMFSTMSPHSEVTDRFIWVGTFPRIESVDGGDETFDNNADHSVRGPRAASMTRIWPGPESDWD